MQSSVDEWTGMRRETEKSCEEVQDFLSIDV